ncbi:hypothetical protein Y5S_00805 [Alcanivorax nanhaiticus]|uniref:Uncharacterized protein n=1 Tax=Alcanivorax nanhaiticus TaxID=1177154 RepID=A0A095TVB8_9GAMM|nr:DUF2459 domain-containing protein [Alcanivorax nanhaiticus]KGD66333.1 hypothetical protein Y5S_00805 [Alcanivorax nanhaiticus]
MPRLLSLLICFWLPLSAQAESDATTILVIRHRWHTGVAFPAEHLSPSLMFLSSHFDAPHYFEFGWGDDAFYRKDNSAGLLLRAMLWPTRSVLHVAALNHHPSELPHGDIQAVCLDSKQQGVSE